MAVRESLESHPGSVHDIAGILGPRITQSVDTAWKWPNLQLQASCERDSRSRWCRGGQVGGRRRIRAGES